MDTPAPPTPTTPTRARLIAVTVAEPDGSLPPQNIQSASSTVGRMLVDILRAMGLPVLRRDIRDVPPTLGVVLTDTELDLSAPERHALHMIRLGVQRRQIEDEVAAGLWVVWMGNPTSVAAGTTPRLRNAPGFTYLRTEASTPVRWVDLDIVVCPTDHPLEHARAMDNAMQLRPQSTLAAVVRDILAHLSDFPEIHRDLKLCANADADLRASRLAARGLHEFAPWVDHLLG